MGHQNAASTGILIHPLFVASVSAVLLGLTFGLAVYTLGRGRNPWLAAVKDIGVLLLASAATVASMALVLNMSVHFFTGFGDVADSMGNMRPTSHKIKPIPVIQAPDVEQLPEKEAARWKPKWKQLGQAGRYGKQLQTTFTGPLSDIRLPVKIWVPKGFDPSKNYNVIVLLRGYPGSMSTMSSILNLPQQMQTAIDKGFIEPTVVVQPETHVDTQEPDCVDIAGRPRVGTWVVEEVPTMIHASFPGIQLQKDNWTVAGLSAGAYCAAHLGIDHPEVYGSILAFSGYDPPLMGMLSEASLPVRQHNHLSHMVAEKHRPPLHMWIMSTTGDPDSVIVVKRILKVKHPGDVIHTFEMNGGHNWGIWREAWPEAMKWLGTIQRDHPVSSTNVSKVQAVSPWNNLFSWQTFMWAILLNIVVVGSALALSRRVHTHPKAKQFLPVRFVLVAASAVSLTLLILLIVNAQGQFYASWTDLSSAVVII